MQGMADEFLKVVGAIDQDNAQKMAMFRAKKSTLDLSIKEHQRKANMQLQSKMN